jgi:hypothetical protein
MEVKGRKVKLSVWVRYAFFLFCVGSQKGC